MINNIIQFHTNIFLWMHGLTFRYSQYNTIIRIIAEDLDYYVIGLAMLALLYFVYKSVQHVSQRRFIFLVKETFRIFLAVFLSWGLSYVIKQITSLPRPFLRLPEHVSPLFDYGGFDSFPSGHATLFMALGVMMSLHHRRIGYIFIFFAMMIAIARVIAGIHFPIDIVVGWLIGGLVSYVIYKKVRYRK